MSEDGGDRSLQNRALDQPLDDSSSKPPSNKKLLCIAFLSFQSFAILQLGAAIWGGSEAMLGDSIAMMIDSLAYLFNMVAERKKEVYATKLQEQHSASSSNDLEPFTKNRMVLEYRKYTYQLELIPPLVSVTTLLVLTIIVLKKAVYSLILDFQGDEHLGPDPDVNLMALFSVINLVLDAVNVGYFASANHALGYKTNRERQDNDTDAGTNALIKPSDDSETDNEHSDNFDVVNVDNMDRLENDRPCSCPKTTSDTGSSPLDESCACPSTPFSTESPSYGSNDSFDDHFLDHKVDDDGTNLNMCSAYTHVFADTIRSLCVVIASLLAKYTEAVTPEIADASAAVVVSILIFLSIFPLIGGMIQTYHSLREVNQLLKANETGENVDEEDQVELLGLVHA
mmetsp:Transcript_10/g.23  ORF Transcript_10/g.23 Transcript_10/m.23 type:complete len:398 (+) Transcript_10:152-1345(+)